MGVFLECWRAPGCRVDEDRKDAMDVALSLGIPFKVLDFKKEYKEQVVDYFYREYQAGRTPNPDTMCNKEIKFGMFYDWAMNNGFDAVATGHYARIQKVKNQISNSKMTDPDSAKATTGTQNEKFKYQLLASTDSNKDQTYFLYLLREEQLAHILFPIGHLTKPEVRQKALELNLKTAQKPDSVGICFIGDINVRKFLEERITPQKGEVVTSTGEIIGEHDGVWFYTIGQRHGFTIHGKYKSASGEWKHTIPPLYVIDKDVPHNRLVVGFGMEGMRASFEVSDVHWIRTQELRDQSLELSVRIRHRGQLLKANVFHQDLGGLRVKLAEPQKGIASGQVAVFYDGEVCLGGGTIV
jgi:tRNA-specific 2-thiouridylase